MHIRKLDIQGFKSFPDRTTFHFGPGISGVVGPNGCGKSNVVDAVKWCLGEQSAKSLRGRSMDDIIFAGSSERAPMGLAEVTLTFAAGDEPFPGELARCEEIQVSRRLFRDGQSEYLVNQQRVRLRDIHDLFLDTGAANRLYSFIEQGRIGQIVNAAPDQRRSLIEEAAGISRYKARREESERKLAETLRNLERATDVVEDLAQRLRGLERQVGKAVRYRRLRSRIRQHEIALGVARYAALAADRKVLTRQLQDVLVEEAVARRDVERQEGELNKGREALEVLETAVGRSRDHLAELEATRRETESARQYQGREQAALETRLVELGAEVERSGAERRAAAERREQATAGRLAAETELAERERELEQGRADVAEGEGTVREQRLAIEALKARILAGARQLAQDEAAVGAARERVSELEAQRSELLARQDSAGSDLQGLADAVAAAASVIEQADRASAEAEAGQAAARAVLQGAEQDLQSARRLRDREEAACREAVGRLSVLQARRDALEALQRNHEGLGEGLQAALATEGALGTVAEHLDVPEALESAMATLLGAALDHVVVADAAAARRVAASGDGRLGILVLADSTGADDDGEPLGLATRVGGTDIGRRAVAQLLEGYDDATDLEAGLAQARSTGRRRVIPGRKDGSIQLVTPAGEVLVGDPGTAGRAVLARRRELAALAEALSGAEQAVALAAAEQAAAAGSLDAAAAAAERARASLDAARTVAADGALRAREGHSNHEARIREHRRAAEHADRVAAELARLDGDLERQRGMVVSGDAEIAARSTRQATDEKALLVAQVSLRKVEEAATTARDALASASSRVAGLRERLVGLRRSESEAGAAEETATRQVARAEADVARSRARIAELIEDDKRLSDALQTLGEEQATAHARLETQRAGVLEERQRQTRLEEKLAVARTKREQISARRAEIERGVAHAKEEIGRIREQLSERYELNVAGMLDRLDRHGHVAIAPDLDDALPQTVEGDVGAGEGSAADGGLVPSELRITPRLLDDAKTIEEWVERLRKDRDALARLGEVNLVAVQEYNEVAARHATLEAQREDLDASVRAIRQTVAKLNRLCRDRFRETFDQVDAYFRETYPRLVGGGQARLVLTNEDDLLETGVDIVVQPPGKRLQNLSLLSGGETAMVAIALIFSLFRVKPSPFCLLDEVDAPLDEGNGARFNSMLREMARLSQFIVITHNKKTMECADTLYGVTMVAPGVSRLVTVQLD